LDKGRLHAGHDTADPALVDVADIAAAARALDVDLLQHAILDQRNARLARGHVDQDFFGHGRTCREDLQRLIASRARPCRMRRPHPTRLSPPSTTRPPNEATCCTRPWLAQGAF